MEALVQAQTSAGAHRVEICGTQTQSSVDASSLVAALRELVVQDRDTVLEQFLPDLSRIFDRSLDAHARGILPALIRLRRTADRAWMLLACKSLAVQAVKKVVRDSRSDSVIYAGAFAQAQLRAPLDLRKTASAYDSLCKARPRRHQMVDCLRSPFSGAKLSESPQHWNHISNSQDYRSRSTEHAG